MASSSVTGAVLERYQTFPISAAVPLYFDSAPVRDTNGNGVFPPYVVLSDEGTVPTYDFELYPLEVTNLRFTVYHNTLAEADSVAQEIKYNTGGVRENQGFDFAVTLPLTDGRNLEFVREREVRRQEGPRQQDGKPVFVVEISYRVQVLRGVSS